MFIIVIVPLVIIWGLNLFLSIFLWLYDVMEVAHEICKILRKYDVSIGVGLFKKNKKLRK